MLRTLTLCLDDFGLHEGVTNAAITLAQIGRLHAISCRVGAPAWHAAAERLRTRLPAPVLASLDVGLHLDLTEYPLREHPRTLPSLVLAAYTGQLKAAEMRAEIRLQLDTFEAAMGHPPTHVDGYQHVHQLPVVREALVHVLRKRGPHRPWLRCTQPTPAARASQPAGRKPHIIRRLGAYALRELAQAHGFAQNGHLLGAYDFDPSPEAYRKRLKGWLKDAKDGDVLVCHASAPTKAPRDTLLSTRVMELSALIGGAFGQNLRSAGIQLGPFVPAGLTRAV
jgi:chitin disaccharide deacetylase